MAVGAARRQGPWPGYRTPRGRAGYARESSVEGSGRVRPPAGSSGGTGLGGRAGCASPDRGAPRRPFMGWRGRVPGPGTSRALRPDDAFRVASVTKSVTAVVAVWLARQGRLALD